MKLPLELVTEECSEESSPEKSRATKPQARRLVRSTRWLLAFCGKVLHAVRRVLSSLPSFLRMGGHPKVPAPARLLARGEQLELRSAIPRLAIAQRNASARIVLVANWFVRPVADDDEAVPVEIPDLGQIIGHRLGTTTGQLHVDLPRTRTVGVTFDTDPITRETLGCRHETDVDDRFSVVIENRRACGESDDDRFGGKRLGRLHLLRGSTEYHRTFGCILWRSEADGTKYARVGNFP